jgi:hypothetical protein
MKISECKVEQQVRNVNVAKVEIRYTRSQIEELIRADLEENETYRSLEQGGFVITKYLEDSTDSDPHFNKMVVILEKIVL